MQDRFNRIKDTVTDRSPIIYKRVVSDIRRRPLFNFCIALVLLFLVLLFNSVINGQKAEVKKDSLAKPVQVYSIGSAPKVSLQGKVDKSNVIKVIAQTAGVVQGTSVTEGDSVQKGTTLVTLSSNYQGDNAPALQAQLAQKQYKNAVDSYSLQKDLISRQRDVATASAENTERLRQISTDSKDETQSLINLNQGIIDSLVETVNTLTAANTTANAQTILQTKQLQGQLQSGVNQLKASQRQLDYGTNTSNPPTLLANLQKEIALKQLDVQAKALDLGKESAHIQASLAYIGASLMNPASPVSGKVDRVYVHAGQVVNPGTVLATIIGTTTESTLSVTLPGELASQVSRVEMSIIHVGNKTYTATPRYISSEASEGTQNVVLFDIPQGYASSLTNSGFVTVELPIGLPSTGGTIPFVPIDAIYQSSDSSYVYVAKDNKVQSKKVILGSVYGRYTEITSGLRNGDQVILNRNIITGEKVEIIK